MTNILETETFKIENNVVIKEENTVDEDSCQIVDILETMDDSQTVEQTGLNDSLFKTVHISLDEETEKSMSMDYKKMPLQKLRNIVVEKQLCVDASKLKKNELFKLLNVEGV